MGLGFVWMIGLGLILFDRLGMKLLLGVSAMYTFYALQIRL